jgi:phosphoribosylanthranilate isomerase
MRPEVGPARRTVVKVCGLTRLQDAQAAGEAGADWLGFILNGESPRRVAPETAQAICAGIPGVVPVAVLVAPSPDQALDLARRAGAARLQLHRVDPAAWPTDFPLPVSVAVPVAEDGSLTAALPPERHLLLLDAAHPARAGGSGRTFPWETARVVAATRPVLLAGGLDDGNVATAIETVLPFGVDASSRLESAPGLKDPDRVRRFVAAVRRCDERIAERS